MTTVAVVKFEGTSKPYNFACDLPDLQKGEAVEVQTENAAKRPATFIGYIEPDLIGYMPKKKVLGRAAVVTNTQFSGKRIRSKEQREFEAKKLRDVLQENHPVMLSTRDIAEAMGWSVDQTSGFVKISMGLENKIVQVYKGWYTAKL